MFKAFVLGFDQLGERRSRGVLVKALGLTLVLYVVLAVLLGWGVTHLPRFEAGWANTLAELFSGLGVLLGLALLFPAVASAFIGLFLDDIADAVERQHYPADPPGRALAAGPALLGSLRFLLVMIALNLLVLPLYVLMLWFPPINLFIFYGLNGYLLSREYFELVAWRHVDRPTARRLRKRNQGRLWLAGAAIAFLLTIPVISLAAPIVATAAMVHLFKRLARVPGASTAAAAR